MIFIKVYLHIFISILILIGAGNIFLRIFKFNNINIYEKVIFGCFFIGTLGLILNFFVALNTYLCTLMAVPALLFSFKKIKEFKIIALVALMTFVTLLFEISNRPDAGLYHLPYISILNDQKIILGLNNLHSRFGYISFFQYISAFFNNYFFQDIGITIPIAVLHSSIILYFFSESQKNDNEILRLTSFFFLIIIFIDMNRYSEFGNDEITHIIFFYFIFNVFKILLEAKYFENFDKIIIISLFLFMCKGTYAIIIIFPAYIFFKSYKVYKILSRNNLICLLVFSLWVSKNVLTTGCLIFPKSFTCFENLAWANNFYVNEEIETEAWAKALPDFNGTISKKNYIENFNWIGTWAAGHLIYIVKKTLPIIVVFLFCLFLSKKKLNNSRKYHENNIVNILLLFSTVTLFYWFLNFPLYRFGSGFIFIFISLLFIKIFSYRQINIFLLKYSFNLIIACMVIIYFKHFTRIYKNYDLMYDGYPWPKIYSFEKNNKKNLKEKVYYNNSIDLFYFIPSKNDEVCFYDKPPCTSQGKNLNLDIYKKFNYKIIVNGK
jgi:hypothetical protein